MLKNKASKFLPVVKIPPSCLWFIVASKLTRLGLVSVFEGTYPLGMEHIPCACLKAQHGPTGNGFRVVDMRCRPFPIKTPPAGSRVSQVWRPSGWLDLMKWNMSALCHGSCSNYPAARTQSRQNTSTHTTTLFFFFFGTHSLTISCSAPQCSLAGALLTLTQCLYVMLCTPVYWCVYAWCFLFAVLSCSLSAATVGMCVPLV